MDPGAQQVILRLQPFSDSYGLSTGVVPQDGWLRLWRTHPLWRLHEFARFERHRTLRVVGAVSQSFGTARGGGTPEPEHTKIDLSPFEDGATVACYVFREPATDFRNTGLGTHLQLKDEVKSGWSVVMTLADILDHIDAVIVPRLAGFVQHFSYDPTP